jgi:hypothetical protein
MRCAPNTSALALYCTVLTALHCIALLKPAFGTLRYAALHCFAPAALHLCRDASLPASAALLLLLALGVGALGLIPVALPGPAQPLELQLLLQNAAAAADASGAGKGCTVC